MHSLSVRAEISQMRSSRGSVQSKQPRWLDRVGRFDQPQLPELHRARAGCAG